jgi:hypothetical protein
VVDLVQPWKGLGEDLLVEKEYRGQGLILRGSRDVALAREVVQERGDLRSAEARRMALSGEQDEPPDPLDVSLFGAVAVAPPLYRVAHEIEEPRTRSFGGCESCVIVTHSGRPLKRRDCHNPTFKVTCRERGG